MYRGGFLECEMELFELRQNARIARYSFLASRMFFILRWEYTGSHYALKIEPSQNTHYYVIDIDMNEPFVVQNILFRASYR